MNQKLRMGMLGGGKDAFIGAIHRHAALMDGLIELCCGALSINPEIAKDSAKSLFLPLRIAVKLRLCRHHLRFSNCSVETRRLTQFQA